MEAKFEDLFAELFGGSEPDALYEERQRIASIITAATNYVPLVWESLHDKGKSPAEIAAYALRLSEAVFEELLDYAVNKEGEFTKGGEA